MLLRGRFLAPFAENFTVDHFVLVGRFLMPPLAATVTGQIHPHQEVAPLTALTIGQVLDVVGK